MNAPARWCPECGAAYAAGYVACRWCRVVLVERPPLPEGVPVIVHRVPDAASGALLTGVLEHQGIAAVLRSATLAVYGAIPRDWSTTAWGEIVVPGAQADDAIAILADYLAALERGGFVRDEDVEAR